MVSLLLGFNILMKMLAMFFTHTAQIWSEEVQVQCDLCTSTDILQHNRRHCSVSFSLPPSKPYTTNRQACQEFFRRCHFASSSWYCSACHICVPVNISLFISALNIWQNMEPVCCNASVVWSKALTKCFTKLYVMWNCDSNFFSAGTRDSCTPKIVVFWLAILFWRNSGYSQRKRVLSVCTL